MSHVGNIIYGADLSVWDDIAAVFGVNSGDVETLFTSGAAKPFAKYKPVRSSVEPELTEADFKAVNYGLRISKFTSMNDVIAGIIGGNEWGYIMPNQVGDALRVTDVINPAGDDQPGYNHDARNFLYDVFVPGAYTKGLGDLSCHVSITPKAQLPASNLYWDDLTDLNGDNISLGDCYLALLLKSGNSYIYVTSGTMIKNVLVSTIQDVYVTLPGSYADALATGTWKAYLFAATTPCTTPVTTGIGSYIHSSAPVYALPEVGELQVAIQAPAQAATAALANDAQHPVDIMVLSRRFSVDFYVAYGATSGTVPVYITCKIYGGNSEGAKTTLYATVQDTLQATTTTQYALKSSGNITPDGFPNYVTIELTFTVGSSSQVYTSPDVSVPFPV